MALFDIFSSKSSSKQEQRNVSFASQDALKVGTFINPLSAGNITVNALDAEIVRDTIDFAVGVSDNQTKSVKSLGDNLLDGLGRTLTATKDAFTTALDASKSSDERLSGKVFTSVNIGLAALAVVALVYYYRKR